VFLVGHVADDELPAHYGAGDAFLFHSLSETFGVVLVEAMAAGLPVIAARTSAVPELVVDGVNGYLVPPFDPSALLDRLRRLVTEPGLVAKLSSTNKAQAVAHYLWPAVAASYEKVLIEAATRLPTLPRPNAPASAPT
jgi:glycosyltransferase involved in cell wall biosynthesis